MTSLSWLHIADLHTTIRRTAWDRDRALEALRADLAHIGHEPIDLIIVSGDLTMHGAAEELDEAQAVLRAIQDRLEVNGIQPTILAVPGNHDVRRPDDPSPHALRTLRNWHDDPEARLEFWNDAGSPARRLVDRALEAYDRWWSQCRFPPHVQIHRGLLPGDFTATIEKGELRFGVVGLCSTFLQVTGDLARGRLAIDPLQVKVATRGDVPGWVTGHDVVLLVTHHPPEWLEPTDRRTYEETIAPPGRFCAHLSGHQHASRRIQHGDRVQIAAPPLFPHHGEPAAGGAYNVGRCVVENTRVSLALTLRDWTADPARRKPGDKQEIVFERRPRVDGLLPARTIERAALRDALYAEHPTAVAARRFATRARIDLGGGEGGAAVDVWHVVVRLAEDQGRLDALRQVTVDDEAASRVLRDAWARFERAPSGAELRRTAHLDRLADDLQQRLMRLEPPALMAVLQMTGHGHPDLAGSRARLARDAIHEATRRGEHALADLAAATAFIAGTLDDPGDGLYAVPALEALAIGDRAVEAGHLPIATRSEGGRRATSATLEHLLVRMFRDRRDFDGFVLDHFPDLYRRLTNSISMEGRARLLVAHADPVRLVTLLERDYPDTFAAHERVLDYAPLGAEVGPASRLS